MLTCHGTIQMIAMTLPLMAVEVDKAAQGDMGAVIATVLVLGALEQPAHDIA